MQIYLTDDSSIKVYFAINALIKIRSSGQEMSIFLSGKQFFELAFLLENRHVWKSEGLPRVKLLKKENKDLIILHFEGENGHIEIHCNYKQLILISSEVSRAYRFIFDYDKKGVQRNWDSLENVYVVVYIPGNEFTNAIIDQLMSSCTQIMIALGFEILEFEEPVYSSFFQKIKFVVDRNLTPEEFEKLFNRAAMVIEKKLLGAPIADQTLKYAQAASVMVETLRDFSEGCIRLEAIIVMKVVINGTPKLLVRQLTYEQMQMFDKGYIDERDLKTVYEILTGGANRGVNTVTSPKN